MPIVSAASVPLPRIASDPRQRTLRRREHSIGALPFAARECFSRSPNQPANPCYICNKILHPNLHRAALSGLGIIDFFGYFRVEQGGVRCRSHSTPAASTDF